MSHNPQKGGRRQGAKPLNKKQKCRKRSDNFVRIFKGFAPCRRPPFCGLRLMTGYSRTSQEELILIDFGCQNGANLGPSWLQNQVWEVLEAPRGGSGHPRLIFNRFWKPTWGQLGAKLASKSGQIGVKIGIQLD